MKAILSGAGRPTREPVLIEDDVTPQSATIALITKTDAMSSSDTNVPDVKTIELLIRVRRLERRQKAMITAMVFLVAFVIMWTVEFSSVGSSSATKSAPATQQVDSPVKALPNVLSNQQK